MDTAGLFALRDIVRAKATIARSAAADETVACRNLEAAVLANLKAQGIVPGCKIRFVRSGAVYFFKAVKYHFGMVHFDFKILKADGTEAIRGGSAGHGFETMDFELADIYPMEVIK
jgi:hypothetical protein